MKQPKPLWLLQFLRHCLCRTQTKELTVSAAPVSLSSHQTKWLREREIKAGDSSEGSYTTSCGFTQKKLYVQHILWSVYCTMQYIGQRKGWTSNLTGYLLASRWTYPRNETFIHQQTSVHQLHHLRPLQKGFPRTYYRSICLHIKSLLRVLKQVFMMYYTTRVDYWTDLFATNMPVISLTCL